MMKKVSSEHAKGVVFILGEILVGALLLINGIGAAVIIRNPFTSASVLWLFAGISLIAEGVLDAVTMILGGTEKVL